jgi:hypothetical protein
LIIPVTSIVSPKAELTADVKTNDVIVFGKEELELDDELLELLDEEFEDELKLLDEEELELAEDRLLVWELELLINEDEDESGPLEEELNKEDVSNPGG